MDNSEIALTTYRDPTCPDHRIPPAQERAHTLPSGLLLVGRVALQLRYLLVARYRLTEKFLCHAPKLGAMGLLDRGHSVIASRVQGWGSAYPPL